MKEKQEHAKRNWHYTSSKNAILLHSSDFWDTQTVNGYLHHSSLRQAPKKGKQWIVNEHPTILEKQSSWSPKRFNSSATEISAALSCFLYWT